MRIIFAIVLVFSVVLSAMPVQAQTPAPLWQREMDLKVDRAEFEARKRCSHDQLCQLRVDIELQRHQNFEGKCFALKFVGMEIEVYLLRFEVRRLPLDEQQKRDSEASVAKAKVDYEDCMKTEGEKSVRNFGGIR